MTSSPNSITIHSNSPKLIRRDKRVLSLLLLRVYANTANKSARV